MNAVLLRSFRALSVSASFALATAARAQGGCPGESAAPVPLPILAPIHGHAADPTFGGYGLWAAGPDYKVSFHDGFVFYPVLGRARPENLPLRWTTERVAVGKVDLVTPEQVPETCASAWRCEYRHPGCVEAYDVRADGVEQSWSLASRPGSGDWVVVGRVSTRLRAAPVGSGHGPVLFCDDQGATVVRYGEAFAVDAAGDRIPAKTRFDGQRIQLTVDGAWLARARFPVVLDPLTRRTAISGAGAAVTGVETGIEYESTGNNTLFVFTRWTSSQDPDAFGVLASNGNLGPFHVIFSDVTASLRSERTACAFVGGADRWVIAFQRSPTSNTVSQIRLWVHDKGIGDPGGGALMFLPLTAGGTTDRAPDVGGTVSSTLGVRALLVYQTDVTASNGNTGNTEVHGVLVDAAARSFGTPFVLANAPVGTRWDREHPAVNQHSAGAGHSWAVVWQEVDHSILNAAWQIVAQRITAAGVRAASANVSPLLVPQARHLVAPTVAGRDERYLVAYVRTAFPATTTGPLLDVTRFDAVENVAAIQVLGFNQVAQSSGSQQLASPALAFDPGTRSHWALAWHDQGAAPGDARVARLGFTGGTVEPATLDLQGDVRGVGVTWDPNGGFLLGYGSPGGAQSAVYAQRLVYPADAVNVPYGTGCGGAVGGGAPYAGSEFFGLSLFNATPATAAILLPAPAPASLDLTVAGMPGCWLLVDPSAWFAFTATTNATGTAGLRLPLPDDPVFLGDLFFQWLYLAPGANAAGVLATGGFRSQVR